jgi:hypothetical protein
VKLPSKIKEKWVKALRSGKYIQGKKALYRPEEATFCCLGVLEHLCLGGKVEYFANADGTFSRFRATPSRDFYDYIGADAVNCWAGSVESNLMAYNDNGKSFTEIADYIEENVGVTDKK